MTITTNKSVRYAEDFYSNDLDVIRRGSKGIARSKRIFKRLSHKQARRVAIEWDDSADPDSGFVFIKANGFHVHGIAPHAADQRTDGIDMGTRHGRIISASCQHA